MSYKPRYYQLAAIDAAINWLRSTTDNGLIEAFQGAGKSVVIAEIAKIIRQISGKQVLCLVPSVELLSQNAEKFKLINEPVSLFSASAKSSSLRHPCVVATPISVKNKLNKFKDQFAAVILDEADRSLTPTIIKIIEHMRQHNPKLRVLGLTGTPFTMKSGYIYRLDVNGKPVPEDKSINPFFTKQIFKIDRKELTDEGFLVPVVFGEISAERYDTSKLELNSMNRFDTKEVDRVFVGQGRRTALIVADVVARAKNRNSVIFFAATVKHAEEILASLPAGVSAMVTGNKSPDREKVIKDYKAGKIRYIVNCEVLCVGFDDPKTDTIAVLRKTESASLYLQIIGRGVRTLYADGYNLDTKGGRLNAIAASDKRECLVLDYTDNPEFHFDEHNIDSPKIRAAKDKKSSIEITAICPSCQTENTFSARKNEEGFGYSDDGYFVDLKGEKVMSEYGPMPSHYGRRCYGMSLDRSTGKMERCNYRWTFKPCPKCEAENDIAARYCVACKGEIIDPNLALVIEYKKMRKDPYIKQVDAVLSWTKKKTLSKKGNECLQVDYVTEYRTFSIWYIPKGDSQFLIKEYNNFMIATKGGDVMPQTITYQKQTNGFYRIFGYNEQLPEVPQDKRMAS